MDKSQSSPSRENYEELEGKVEGVDWFPIYVKPAKPEDVTKQVTKLMNKHLKRK